VKFLIDTECWLWGLAEPERLSSKARELMIDRESEVYLSAVSSFEIAVKAAIGKLALPEPPPVYVPKRMASQNIKSLPIEHAHALRVYSLPPHHKDPFDRLLIAQAQVESLAIMTADRQFANYDVPLIWAGDPRLSPKRRRDAKKKPSKD